MSEPLTASLERLRTARLEPAAVESLPSQSLASRRLRRLDLPDSGLPDAEVVGMGSPDAGLVAGLPPAESEWVAAAQGRLTSLDDAATGRPRLALGVRAALAGALALVALGGGIFSAHLLTASAKPLTIASASLEDDAAVGEDSAGVAPVEGDTVVALAPAELVVVHVAGAVNSPGIVELPAGSRVASAVELAGGATAEAELSAINLARVLVDGEQILIPVVGQVLAPDGATPGLALPVPGLPALDLATVRNEAGLINLNQAGTTLLQELPGIGPALAGRIIEYRASVGGFNSVDQLQEVSGIGPAVMNNVRDKVTV